MADAIRTIKKYPNRRLYDTANSGYITLADVKQMVLENIEFQVVDAKTSEDLTRSILLQIILDEESGGLRAALADEKWTSGPRAGARVFTIPVVFAIMVFFALCMQCGATVAVIWQSLNWRWAVGSFLVATGLAWVGAVAVYQIGTHWIG